MSEQPPKQSQTGLNQIFRQQEQILVYLEAIQKNTHKTKTYLKFFLMLVILSTIAAGTMCGFTMFYIYLIYLPGPC
jgi:hypothetical protein